MQQSTNFIDNKKETLNEQFNEQFKQSKCFDCLLDSFYITGFHKIYEKLENIEKIRVIIGSGIDNKIYKPTDGFKEISEDQIHKNISENLINEIENSDYYIDFKDNSFKKSINLFMQWILDGKLEIRAYKTRVPSKVYVMSYDDERSKGCVFTGATNITAQNENNSNIFFDLNLRNDLDYSYASSEFNEIWEESVDVKDDYFKIICENGWINSEITPRELYLKFIYEYLSDKIDVELDCVDDESFPEGFKKFQYQTDAVLQAKSIIDKYGGVFISDVVGLGKTFMGALLIKELKGETVVLAPPRLIKEESPGGWYQVIKSFHMIPHVESSSTKNLEKFEKDADLYDNILIDESHDFRNKKSEGYKILKRICKNKNVILISATPLNNEIDDLQNQINLFMDPDESIIPGIGTLNEFFGEKRNSIKEVKDEDELIKVADEINEDIRVKVLKHIMVRRIREDIKTYYKEDAEEIQFPEVNDPHPIYYEFDEKLNKIFNDTIEIIGEKLTYARYFPHHSKYNYNSTQGGKISIQGIRSTQIVKGLESGVSAFKSAINKEIETLKLFIKIYEEEGVVYTLGNSRVKVLNYMKNGDYASIDRLILEEKNKKKRVKKYPKSIFKDQFKKDLYHDLELFNQIKELWDEIDNETYPKNVELVKLLKNDLKGKKVILFTEFIETANFLEEKIRSEVGVNVLKVTGQKKDKLYQDIIDNFDGNISKEDQRDDFDILITTDVLSEGMNLHRSSTIINYDIPWNPTKIIQRVGRVDRVGATEDINIYNFFPTSQIEENIKIEEVASDKLNKFVGLLGSDSKVLNDESSESHNLFDALNAPIEEEKNNNVSDELQYISELRDIREDEPELYEKIKSMSRKAVVAVDDSEKALISLIKIDGIKKIIKTTNNTQTEIDFIKAAEKLESKQYEESIPVTIDFYDYLEETKTKFNEIVKQEDPNFKGIIDVDVDKQVKEIKTLQEDNLNSSKVHDSEVSKDELVSQLDNITSDDNLDSDAIEYLNNIKMLLENGLLSEYYDKFNEKIKNTANPLKVYNELVQVISPDKIKQLKEYELQYKKDSLKLQDKLEYIL